MRNPVLKIRIIQDPLQPIRLGHLILVHQGLMRPAQRRRHIQPDSLQLRLHRAKTPTPTRTTRHPESRSPPRPVSRTGTRLRGGLQPGLPVVLLAGVGNRSSFGSDVPARACLGARCRVRMTPRMRGSNGHRRNDGSNTKG